MDAVSRDIRFPWIGLSSGFSLPTFVLFSEARLPSIEKQQSKTTRSKSETTETLRKLADAQVPSQSDPQCLEQPAPDPLTTIPEHVADFLLENFITRTVPSYPVFHEPWLRACHAAVIHHDHDGTGGSSSYQRYIVSLLMAVSLTTAARSKQVRANAMAFTLFQHAARYTPEVLTNDLPGLQAVVLLHLYAIMNPAVADIYFLAGIMMQTCIDLGLHREDDEEDEGVDCLTRDIKRRLFWVAWELDACCSAGLTRRVTLLPDQITTGFPTELDDSAIDRHHIDPRGGRPAKFISARVRTFRLIESEIISTLFHGHPIPTTFDDQLETWMADVERRIHSWSARVYEDAAENRDPSLAVQWDEMSVFADIADPLIIVTLFRPCPRVKHPTVPNLIKAFRAAVKVAEGYSRQAQMDFGSPKYTFQPCHHVFSSAMVFLHTIRQCGAVLASIFPFDEIEGFMQTFSRFFSLTAERWPAAVKCVDEYHRLLAPVRDGYAGLVGVHLDTTPSYQFAGSTDNNDPLALTWTPADDDAVDGADNHADALPNDATIYVNALFDSIGVTESTTELDAVYNDAPFDWCEEFEFDHDYQMM
jgi:hypothetical protein